MSAAGVVAEAGKGALEALSADPEYQSVGDLSLEVDGR